MSKTIQAAAQALTYAQGARDRIAATLESYTTADEATAAQAREVERLTREHAEAAAAAALGEITAAELEKASKALDAARKALDAARAAAQADAATREGLTRRLEKAERELIEARAALELAEVEWLRAQAVEADRAYTEAAAAAWQAWGRVFACRAVLVGKGYPLDAIQRIHAPELRAAGPVSAAAGHANHPHAPHGWAESITPRHDEAAARLLIESELRALREVPPSLAARAVSAFKRAAA